MKNKKYVVRLLSISLCLLLFMPLLFINNSMAESNEETDPTELAKMQFDALDQKYRNQLSTDQDKFVAFHLYDEIDATSELQDQALYNFLANAKTFEDYKQLVSNSFFDPSNLNSKDEKHILEKATKFLEDANVFVPPCHYIHYKANSHEGEAVWKVVFGDFIDGAATCKSYTLYFIGEDPKLYAFNDNSNDSQVFAFKVHDN